jgi:O-antigen/teichoic acid export membrane protein
MLRALDYRRWIQPMIAAAVVKTVIACWMAMKGYGFWSIVIATLLSSVVNTVWFILLGHPKIRVELDRVTARDLLQFGLPLFSSGLLAFALFNADNFIIGTVSGAAVLGYYAIAFNWGSMACTVVYEVVHSVLFPSLARMQDDRERLRRAYIRILEQLSAIGVLVHVGLFCCAREFLVLVLGRGGERWLPACRALQILCIYGLVRLLMEPLGNVLVALGRTSLLFRAVLLASCCEILLLYPALRLGGINAVAIIVTIAYAIQWFVYWPMLRNELDIGVGELTNILMPCFVAGACGWAVGAGIESLFPLGFPTFALMVTAITLVYVVVQGYLSSWRWFGEWRQMYLARVRGV